MIIISTFSVEIPAPDIPRSLQAISVTATTVLLEWQPPADLNIAVNMYSLTISEMQFGLSNITVTSTTTSRLVIGLQEFNNYTCELRAVGIYGIQSQPLTLEFVTLEGGEKLLCKYSLNIILVM